MFTEKEVYDILNDVDHIDDAYMNLISAVSKKKTNTSGITARQFINKKHPTMVTNWSNQASLLSYDQVAKLMEEYKTEHK